MRCFGIPLSEPGLADCCQYEVCFNSAHKLIIPILIRNHGLEYGGATASYRALGAESPPARAYDCTVHPGCQRAWGNSVKSCKCLRGVVEREKIKMEGRSPITGLPFHECIPTLRQRTKIHRNQEIRGLSYPCLREYRRRDVRVWFAHLLPRHKHATQPPPATTRPPLEKWSRGTHRVES